MTALTLNRREGKPYRETIPSHPRCALTHTPPSAFCPKTTFARHDALDYLHVISFLLLLLLLLLILSLLLPISFGVPACTGTHKHTQGHTPMTGCCRCRAPLHFAPVSAQQRLGSARLKRRRERERKKKRRKREAPRLFSSSSSYSKLLFFYCFFQTTTTLKDSVRVTT